MSASHGVPAHFPDSRAHPFILTEYELSNFFRTWRSVILGGIGAATSAVLTDLVAFYRPAELLATPLSFCAPGRAAR